MSLNLRQVNWCDIDIDAFAADLELSTLDDVTAALDCYNTAFVAQQTFTSKVEAY